MKKLPKAVSVSIVIPVYNEQNHIKQCLESIKRQTVAPDEVIVVDNNCTDNTIKIVKRYSFVKIISESKQGLIAARNKGFQVANGEILCRIDADSRITNDWVERVVLDLRKKDASAVTGLARTCLIPFLPWPTTTFWSKVYFWDTTNYFKTPIIWGSNMAIRSSAWHKISENVSLDDTLVHEDQDISILLGANKLRILFDPKLIIHTGGEQFGYLPKTIEYARRRAKTRRYHSTVGNLKVAQDFTKFSLIKSDVTRILLLPVGLLYLLLSIFATLIQLVLKKRI